MRCRSLRVLRFFLLSCSLTAAAYAQQPSTPNSSTSPAAATAAPAKSALPPSERVVLKVGNVQVTQAEFESLISPFRGETRPGRSEPSSHRRELRVAADAGATGRCPSLGRLARGHSPTGH